MGQSQKFFWIFMENILNQKIKQKGTKRLKCHCAEPTFDTGRCEAVPLIKVSKLSQDDKGIINHFLYEENGFFCSVSAAKLSLLSIL